MSATTARPKPDSGSPYRRPYVSRRKRTTSRKDPKAPLNKFLLRLLLALLVVLIATLVIIFKGQLGYDGSGRPVG